MGTAEEPQSEQDQEEEVGRGCSVRVRWIGGSGEAWGQGRLPLELVRLPDSSKRGGLPAAFSALGCPALSRRHHVLSRCFLVPAGVLLQNVL